MWEKAARLIYRPRRIHYDPSTIPIINEVPTFGPVERVPVTFTNPSQELLIGSFYRAPHSRSCVVYCHGNSSCQTEGRYLVSWYVPIGVSLFCFDFSGCGSSSGEFSSLGYRETGDLVMAIQHIRREFGIDKVAVWGRSMGAVVALSCLAIPELAIRAVVADSPFTSVVDVAMQLGRRYHLPKWICKRAVRTIRKKVIRAAKFDFASVRTIESVARCEKPVLFVHGEDDRLVNASHTNALYAACQGRKKMMIIKGGHFGPRPDEVSIEATEFLCAALGIGIRFDRPD
jgi:pimeloyl-ACP methyl ester carboxylesterase